MNPQLLIFKGNALVGRSPVKGDRCLIGRHRKCDVVLAEENAASREHVIIERVDGDFYLEDRKSRNGTLLNGKPLRLRVVLRDGDEIAIGETRLKFTGLEAGDEGDDGQVTHPWTPGAPGMNPKKPRPGKQAPAASGPGTSDLVYKLTVLEGPTKGVSRENWPGSLAIGKAIDNELVLIDDDLVSAHHARLVREGPGFVVEDLESTNGTFVNRRKIQRHHLASGDKIKIGKSVLLFEVVDLRRRKQRMLVLLASVSVVCLAALIIKALLPPDRAGQLLVEALEHKQKGELGAALQDLEMAIKLAPGRDDLKKEHQDVQKRLNIAKSYDRAMTEAGKGNYPLAMQLCEEILRVGKHPHVESFRNSLKKVSDANQAIQAQNWASAETLLNEACESDPKSQLLADRLRYVRSEMVVSGTMQRARKLGSESPPAYEEAVELLKKIPTNSVYHPGAGTLQATFEASIRVRDLLAGATNAFRQGNLTNALIHLKDAETNRVQGDIVIAFRKQILDFQILDNRVNQARETLRDAGATNDTQLLNLLLQVKVACEELVKRYNDPANKPVLNTQKALSDTDEDVRKLSKKKLEEAQRLKKASQSVATVDKEDDLLTAQNIMRGRDLRLALEAASLARQADQAVGSKDKSAADLEGELRETFKKLCNRLFRHASLLIEKVGDADSRKLARRCYDAITQMALEGDPQWEEAKKKMN